MSRCAGIIGDISNSTFTADPNGETEILEVNPAGPLFVYMRCIFNCLHLVYQVLTNYVTKVIQ